jgi:hypothetical protein
VGAFNQLENASFQTTPVNNLLQYAATTTGVTGIDLHLHVSSYNGNNGPEGTDLTGGLVAAVTYAQSIFGTTKPMMSTEFSLTNYFENYLSDTLSTTFLSTYPDPGVLYEDSTGARTVLGFINYAISSGGVSSPEWYYFLRYGDGVHQTYFTDRAGSPSFLGQVETFFSANNFTVATYAISQETNGIMYSGNPASPYTVKPWALSPIFCNSTCTQNPTTYNDSKNLDWPGDFAAQPH